MNINNSAINVIKVKTENLNTDDEDISDLGEGDDECDGEFTSSKITKTTSSDFTHSGGYYKIQQKLQAGIYKTGDKNGRSKVWEIFAIILDETNNVVPDVVACRTCSSIFKFAKSTSNLLKHKCYLKQKHSRNTTPNSTSFVAINQQTKAALTRDVTEWSIRNCRPFSIVADEGLKRLATSLIKIGAQFGENIDAGSLLPHPTTVSRNVCELYETQFAEVKRELGEIRGDRGYSVTFDIWSESQLVGCSYLLVTIHYIHHGVICNRLLALPNADSNYQIRDKVAECLKTVECQLNEDRVTFVLRRDNTNNTFDFHHFRYIHCISNALHCAVDKALQEVPQFKEIIVNCGKLIRFIRKSCKKPQLHNSLKSMYTTKWTSILHSLQSIECQFMEIYSFLIETNEIHRMNNLDHNEISAICQLLEKFEKAVKSLEDDNCPTLHLVIPQIAALRKMCSTDSKQSDNVTHKLKMALHQSIETMVSPQIGTLHRIALFLFPPTNKLITFSQLERSQTIDECKLIMQQFMRMNEEKEEEEENESMIHQASSDVCDNGMFADFVPESNPIDSRMHLLMTEIHTYTNMSVPYSEEFKVLQWWQTNRNMLPLLYKTSNYVLATPATTAFSASAFSRAGRLLSANRESLVTTNSDEMINKILFLNGNLRK